MGGDTTGDTTGSGATGDGHTRTPVVVVAHGDTERALGLLLANDVAVKMRLDLTRRQAEVADGLPHRAGGGGGTRWQRCPWQLRGRRWRNGGARCLRACDDHTPGGLVRIHTPRGQHRLVDEFAGEVTELAPPPPAMLGGLLTDLLRLRLDGERTCMRGGSNGVKVRLEALRFIHRRQTALRRSGGGGLLGGGDILGRLSDEGGERRVRPWPSHPSLADLRCVLERPAVS